MWGMPFEGHNLLGYDNFRNEYVSVWRDNLSTAPMVSRGTFDPATKSLTMTATMDDFMSGARTSWVRQVTTIADPTPPWRCSCRVRTAGVPDDADRGHEGRVVAKGSNPADRSRSPGTAGGRSRDGARNPRGRRDSRRRSRRRRRRAHIRAFWARAGRRSRRARRSRARRHRGIERGRGRREAQRGRSGALLVVAAAATPDAGRERATRSRAARRDLQHAARVSCRHQLRPVSTIRSTFAGPDRPRPPDGSVVDPGRSAAPGGFRERDDLEPGIAPARAAAPARPAVHGSGDRDRRM